MEIEVKLFYRRDLKVSFAKDKLKNEDRPYHNHTEQFTSFISACEKCYQKKHWSGKLKYCVSGVTVMGNSYRT